MIVDIGKYYLYRHIRLDTNEVFYIGVSQKYNMDKHITYRNTYKRAHNKVGRNKQWKDITNNTPYIVEILCESNNYSFLMNKETEFISIYGRLDIETGSLCNLTNGGQENKGRVCSPVSIKKTSESHYIPVYDVTTKEIFNSIKDAATASGISASKLAIHLKKQIPNCKYQYVDTSLIKEYENTVSMRVRQNSTGKVFNSIRDAGRATGLCREKIRAMLKNKTGDFEKVK